MVGGKDRTPEEEKEAEEYLKKFLKDNPDFPTKADYKKIIESEKKKKIESPKGYSRIGLKLDNYIDNVKEFWNINPFFYDKTQMFWMWNKTDYKYELTDEINIMNLIDQELGFGGQTVTSKIKGNYLEAFKRVGRLHQPTQPPKTWIQFKEIIIDAKTGETIKANPNYFITNPIPWELGKTENTPFLDQLFKDWQNENKDILYEIIAYCLLPDYPIHVIIANIGTGRNGKTQFTKIIEKFIGRENVTSAELDSLIKERFESAKLHKKLVCLMGETNFGVMSQTSLLKKLCGGDLISYEYKNKMPFTDTNYAKIIINTNSLPSTGDTTDGFFRRWLILNWQNNFQENGKDIFEMIPEKEYNNLALKCLNKLKSLLEKGQFSIQGSIDDRKHKYIMASNPITLFLNEKCEIGDGYYIKAKDLYHAYINYLQEKKRRIVKRKEFNQILAEEGYQAEHTQKKRIDENGYSDFETSYWIDGLKLKKILPILPILPSSYLSFPTGGSYIGNMGELGEKGEKNDTNFRNNEENSILTCDFNTLLSILLDKVPQEIKVEDLVSYGFDEKNIEHWKEKGLIFEQPVGTIKLL